MHFTDLMRAADPAVDVQPHSPAQRDDALDAAMASSDKSSSGRPRNRRLGRIAVGIAASLVIGGVTLPSFNHDGEEAQAAEVLRTAAIHASDPPVRPRQYWEVTSTLTGMMGVCPTEDNDGCYDLCVGRRDNASYVEVSGQHPSWFVLKPEEVLKVLPTKAEVAAPEPLYAQTMNLAPNDLPRSWQLPSRAWLAALTRDTGQLRERLSADLEEYGHDHQGTGFTNITDVLRSEARAAACRDPWQPKVVSTRPQAAYSTSGKETARRPMLRAVGRVIATSAA